MPGSKAHSWGRESEVGKQHMLAVIFREIHKQSVDFTGPLRISQVQNTLSGINSLVGYFPLCYIHSWKPSGWSKPAQPDSHFQSPEAPGSRSRLSLKSNNEQSIPPHQEWCFPRAEYRAWHSRYSGAVWETGMTLYLHDPNSDCCFKFCTASISFASLDLALLKTQ